MKEYLKLLIVMVTLVSVALIILPEGRMKKTTCIAFSFIITLTLLSPIKNFITDYVINYTNQEYNYSIEQDYQISVYQYVVKQILKENGIKAEDVYLEFDNFQTNVIKKVGIKLDNSVLNENEEHINIIVKVRECLSERLRIDISNVYVYE